MAPGSGLASFSLSAFILPCVLFLRRSDVDAFPQFTNTLPWCLVKALVFYPLSLLSTTCFVADVKLIVATR